MSPASDWYRTLECAPQSGNRFENAIKPRLLGLTVPASIHYGDADTTVPPQHARLLAEAIPGAQLQLYPGHGHFSILGAAREMLAALAA